MVDGDRNEGEIVAVSEAAPEDESSRQIEPLNQILNIQRERVRVEDRRTDVAMKIVEASDAADKRQYEYHVKQLDANERLAKRRISLAEKIVGGFGAFFALIVFSLLYMMFFGTENQADRAGNLLYGFVILLGGGGLSIAIQLVARWLMNLR